MNITLLDSSHADACRDLFTAKKKYMGDDNILDGLPDAVYDFMFSRFTNTYLAGLKNFHAMGAFDDEGKVQGFITFYETPDEPSWYYTLCRSVGGVQVAKDMLDAVIAHNEAQGRLKFYTLFNSRHAKLLRRFSWSAHNNERYGYFDEFEVPEKCKCFYTTHWEVLYKRALLPINTTVRCSYLKQEYRTALPIGGSL